MDKYIPIIGFEIHLELSTMSKMFCSCSADYFREKPNTHTCPVCLGLPGAIPVPNKKAIEWTVKIAQALNCHINAVSKFDRKHYFYPDLPKGYQISQYDEPIGTNGSLIVDDKKYSIERVHLEEDTGKLIHKGDNSLIDFNRSGIPLVEIVTRPDFHSSSEAGVFLDELYTTLTYLEVSDCSMEKGSMRIEPNISMKFLSQKELPSYKVEIKNINSFRFVKQAIEYELKRQKGILEKGESPPQETRGFDEKKQITYGQRTKEEAHDYRYFPEPDIPAFSFSQKELDSIANSIPELPSQKRKRYVDVFQIAPKDAEILTRDIFLLETFEKVLDNDEIKQRNLRKATANLLINKKETRSLFPEQIVELVIASNTTQTADPDELNRVVIEMITKNQKVVGDFKKGKLQSINVLLGEVMREMKGKADATVVRTKLEELLK